MKELMLELKSAISERHKRMETLPYITALTDGTLPLRSYVAQLKAMEVIYSTLDQELPLAPSSPVFELYRSRPPRLAHIQEDLERFDHLRIPDSPKPAEKAHLIADKIRETRRERPQGLLAYIYVLEGMTLGNIVNLEYVENCLRGKIESGSRYYQGYGDKTLENWVEFCSVMNSLDLDRSARDELIEDIFVFFDLLESLHTELYPLEEKITPRTSP